jgi:hypothetical protein
LNAFVLTGGTFSLQNAAALTINRGGLIRRPGRGTTGFIGGTGSLVSPGELVVYTQTDNSGVTANSGARRYAIDVPITATALTKNGDVPLTLSRTNSLGAGGVFVNGSELVLAAPGAISNSAPITLARGGLRLNVAGETFTGDLTTLASAQEQSNSVRLPVGTTTFAGAIRGDGWLFFTGSGSGTWLHVQRRDSAGYSLEADTALEEDGTITNDAHKLYIGTGGNVPAYLYGNATIHGLTQFVNSVATPGLGDGPDAAGAGRLTLGTAAFYGSKLREEIYGNLAGTQYDQIVVQDSLLFGNPNNTLDLRLMNGFVPTPGEQFVIFDDRFSGAVTGTFQNLPEGSIFNAGGTLFQISYTGGDGNDVVLTTVPEPASSAVMSAAAMSAIASRRRRRRVRSSRNR